MQPSRTPHPRYTHTQTQSSQHWLTSSMYIDATSVLNIVVCCSGAPLQEMALGKIGGLAYLTCEEYVFGAQSASGVCPVPASLVQGWNAARMAANVLIEGQGATSGKHMMEILTRKDIWE